MFTLKPVAYDFACSSGSDSMMSAARRKARTVFHAKYAITPAPRSAMLGTHPWMLVTAGCATTDTGEEERVRGRRPHPDEKSGAPRSRHGLGRDNRVHGSGRRRERKADAGAGEDRPEDVQDHVGGHREPPHEGRAASLIPTGLFVRTCASAV